MNEVKKFWVITMGDKGWDSMENRFTSKCHHWAKFYDKKLALTELYQIKSKCKNIDHWLKIEEYYDL